MSDVLMFMWNEQMRGNTMPFFKFVPVEQLTGETIYRLWTCTTGWTQHFISVRP